MVEENSGSVRLEKQPIFYCEKYALKPDTDEEDKIKISTFDDDSNIREVLRDLEGKIIGKRLLFSDVNPQNPSVKKWINHLMVNYPALQEDTVEDLINTFREALYSRSKEKFRIIVGIFLLKDAVLLIHSKKDPAIAEWEGTINSVKLILHPKNILRVAIIKEENGTVFFSAFEYSKKWSRGHAEFWKIDPEDVSWDSLGNIVLRIEVDGFDHGMQMQIESEDLDAMIKDDRISPSGNIKIGKSEGKIVSVDVFRKTLDFNEFYDFYITQKENLEEHRKKFKELIQPGAIQSFDAKSKNKHKFKDYEEKVVEITSGEQVIHQKNHPQYTICFFSDVYPRIVPSKSLISKLYDAIFENHRFDIWHAGEETSRSQYTIGALNIFNNCKVSREFDELSQKFLNVISDVSGKKEKYLLQFQFCQFWKANLTNEHLNSMFDFISEDRLIPELKFEFKNDGLFTKENQLEFKSASEFNGKIMKFTKDTLLPTIDKYIDEDGLLTRNCILYGVEDDNSIRPILHLKSDMIPKIEDYSNPSLKEKNIQIKAFPIPVNSGVILLILLLPILKK